MMLRYSLGRGDAADAIEAAVGKVLDMGLRTGDIYSAANPEGTRKVGTREMGEAVVAALTR
jgi:3-isopropylmalate dehydrogenase